MGSFVVQTVLVPGLFALVVGGACRGLRLSPSVRFGLWLVVLAKLLVPPFVHWPLALTTLLPDVVVEAWVESPVQVPLLPGRMRGAAFAAIETAASVGLAWSIGWVLIGGWIAGSLMVLLRHGRRVLRFNRALMGSHAAPQRLREVTVDVARHLRIAPPAVRVIDSLGTPIVWSWGRPRVVVPAGMLRHGDGAMWSRILAHELAHIRRRDHLYVWLEFLGTVVWWWNPIFRLVRHRLRENAEMAADEWAVRVAGGSRRAYAESLLWVARWGAQLDHAVPALAASRGLRRRFANRLQHIITGNHAPGVRLRTAAGLTVLGLIALPGWTTGPVAADSGTALESPATVGRPGAVAAAPSGGGLGSRVESRPVVGQLLVGYPNPFHAVAALPFTLYETAFEDGSAIVSLTVFDLMGQPAGHPVLYEASQGRGTRLDGLELSQPGTYEGCWEVRDERDGLLPPGVYMVHLRVNGRPVGTVRMFRVSEDVGEPRGACRHGSSG